jgi:hypothetical protein
MASVPIFRNEVTPEPTDGNQALVDVSPVPTLAPAATTTQDNDDASSRPRTLADEIRLSRTERVKPLGGEISKIEALNMITDRYVTALTKIGNGENIDGIDLDVANGIRKQFFSPKGDNKGYNHKIPLGDLAVFLAVRTGRIQPSDDTLPYIIQSLTSVASGGNVRGDFKGTRFMQFQKMTDDETHKYKEGLSFQNISGNTVLDREWEPRVVFEALQKHFDTMEETQAERIALFNKKLLAKNCGLKEGENFSELSHERKFEVANNLSSLFDRDWLTTRIDASLKRWLGTEYTDIDEIEGGDALFRRIMHDESLTNANRGYVGLFRKAVANGDYTNTPSGFAKYIHDNVYEWKSDIGEQYPMSPIGVSIGMVSRKDVKTNDLDIGDEAFRAVENEDGTFSLQVRRGGRTDRENSFISSVVSKFLDADGRYAAAEAVSALNEYPEAWTIVNRTLDNQEVAAITNGMDGSGLLNDLFAMYDRTEDKDRARNIANAALMALNIIDTRTGVYAENGLGRTVAGAMNILANVAKGATDHFRDDDYSSPVNQFLDKYRNGVATIDGPFDLSGDKTGFNENASSFIGLGDGFDEGTVSIGKTGLGTKANGYTSIDNVLADGTVNVGELYSLIHPEDKDEVDRLVDAASKLKSEEAAQAEAFAESMRASIYNLTELRVFDEGSLIGGGLQFFADIYALGKYFEVGGALLGTGLNLTGKATLAAGKLAGGANRMGKFGELQIKFGRAMTGAKNMELANAVKKHNKEIKAIRKSKELDVTQKIVEENKLNDAFLDRVVKKYKANPTEISEFVDKLARFVGKIPTLATMYNHETDRAYAEMLANTTVLDDNEFSEEERTAMKNFAREKGAVTTIMLSGLSHYLPKGFKKIMGISKGEFGATADALDKMFVKKICKGQAGYTLTPENEFLLRCCLASAFSKAGVEAAKNGAFMFTINEANVIIDNQRKIWEKKRLDPMYKPTVYDWLSGTGDALWEGGKAMATVAIPASVIGVARGVRRYNENKEAIRNTRYKLTVNELVGDSDSNPNMKKEQAVDVVLKALAGIDLARSRGDKAMEEGILSDIRKAGGAKAVIFFRQLDNAVRNRRGGVNIGLSTALDMTKSQANTPEALKATLKSAGYGDGVKVEDIGNGRMLITLDPIDYGDAGSKKMSFVVTRGTIPVTDGKGNWSQTFVDTIVKDLKEGKIGGRVKRIWDAMTPVQRRKAVGYTREDGKVQRPRNIKGIWEAAMGLVNTKGVFLNKEAAKKYSTLSESEVNLYDGLIVLSESSRNYDQRITKSNDALRSLDNIRKMAAEVTKNGGADVKTFLHEFFHAVTETLPIDSKLRKDLKKVFSVGARGGDWREGFVDAFLHEYDIATVSEAVGKYQDWSHRSLINKVAYVASNFLKGLFGKKHSDADIKEANMMRDFISEAVVYARNEAKTMREIEKLDKVTDRRVDEIQGKGIIEEEGLFSIEKEDRIEIDTYDTAKAVRITNELEKEIVNGERSYSIVGGSTRAGRRAVEISNLPNGRNLLVGAHIIANRFGRLELSDPAFWDERTRSKEINGEIKLYAKSQGRWMEDIDKVMTKNGAKRYGSGSEATVWLSKTGKTVFKAITPDTLYDGDMRLLLDRVAIHNYISPDAPLRVVGFGNFEGGMNIVVAQPFFKSGALKTLTQKGLYACMEAAGFKRVEGAHITDFGQAGEEVWISKDRKYIIGDLAPRNVALSGNTLQIIDMAAYKNTPWLRDRADIPEKLRPSGQPTYKEMKADFDARRNSAIVEYFENMGLTHEEAVRRAEGQFQIVGARGLEALCGQTEASKILWNISNSFFEFYNQNYKRKATEYEEYRTGSDEVRRKKVSFVELNKEAGVHPIRIKTKNGVELDAYAIFGGTGFISAEKWYSAEEIPFLGGVATGDSGIRFVWAGDAARLPKSLGESMQNPKLAQPYSLVEFFSDKKSGRFVSNEAEEIFSAYPAVTEVRYGREYKMPALADVQVFVRGSDAYSDYLKENRRVVSEPYFGFPDGDKYGNRNAAKRSMVLVDDLGNIVIHEDANIKQIAAGINEAVVKNVQLRERWELPVTRSALQFFRNIEAQEKDLHRQTQLLRLGSGRMRALIFDIISNKVDEIKHRYPDGNIEGWFNDNIDVIKDKVSSAIAEAISNSHAFFASEVEATAYSSSFIKRSDIKSAREKDEASNVPVEMRKITDSMLEEIGAMREWIERGLVDVKSRRVPTAERNLRVLEFYKTIVTRAIWDVFYSFKKNKKSRDYSKGGWLYEEFGNAADDMFREYVRAYREGSVKKATYDVSTGYDGKTGERVVKVESDVDKIDPAENKDAMISYVITLLQKEGVAGLSKLNDPSTEVYKVFDSMAREGAKDVDEVDIKNNKMSAALEAMRSWKEGKRNDEGLFSIESERELRIENKRLQAIVDRAEARRLRLRSIHNAHGLIRAELDKRIGMDSIACLKHLDKGGQKALVDKIEENALLYIRNNNPDLAKLKPEEFMKSPIVAAEFGATVASWLSNAAQVLSFGQVRENAKRDAARIRRYTERPPLELIKGLLHNNIVAISRQVKAVSVEGIIDRMDKVINRDAMGNQGVVVNKEIYNRKIEPRLQQYWKMAKKAFRMTQKEVDERLEQIENKYGDFSEAFRDIKEGKGSEGIVPTEEILLERDMAQLEYVALTRYGALSEKNLGEVSDKVTEVAQDISIARLRLEAFVGPKSERFASDIDALVKGCVDFRRGEKDGKYKLSEVASTLRSALYFNSPNMFRRLAMYFKSDSEAYRICMELCRDMSIAHIEMEQIIAEYENTLRSELPAIFESKYGKLSFGKLMGILHEKVADYEDFSRSGWRIPEKNVEYVEFDTGNTYAHDIAKYTVDVRDASGKVIHKKGDTIPSTIKLNKDGKLIDETGAEIGAIVHRKGDSITELLPKAVGIDDPRHPTGGHASRLSMADLIYIYAARRQGDMRKNNIIYGCDDAYMRKLEATIGKEGVAMADWLVSRFGSLREKLTVVSERITGMPVMSPDVLFVPLLFEGGASVSGTTRYKIDAFPSFLTRRQNHDRNILKEDIGVVDVFSRRVGDSAHYIAFSDIIERVKATFCDKKVENAYRELLGDGAFKQVYRQLFESLSGGVREPTGWFGRLRNFTTATTLFFHLTSPFKQLEGIAAYSSHMGVGHWLCNLHHMGRAYGLLSSSNAIKNKEFRDALEAIGNPFEARKSEGYSDIIVSLKEARDRAEKGTGLLNNPLTRFYMRNGLSLTTAIDSLASSSMGCAFYNQRYAHHLKQGMTMEEARRASIADLDYAIQETQQSSRREFLLDPQADTLWGRVLTQFAGPAYTRLGMELEALHRAVYVDKNAKAWKDLVNKVVSLHIVCPTALSLLGFGAQSICHRADDEEWARRAVRDWCVAMCLGPFSGWFIGGAAVQYAAQDMANGFSGENIRVSQLRNGAPMVSKLYELITRTSTIAKEVIDGIGDGDIDTDRVAEEVGKLIDSLSPPIRDTKRIIHNLSE